MAGALAADVTDAAWECLMDYRDQAHEFLGALPDAIGKIADTLISQYGPDLSLRAVEAAGPAMARTMELMSPVIDEKILKWGPPVVLGLGITTGFFAYFIDEAMRGVRGRRQKNSRRRR